MKIDLTKVYKFTDFSSIEDDKKRFRIVSIKDDYIEAEDINDNSKYRFRTLHKNDLTEVK